MMWHTESEEFSPVRLNMTGFQCLAGKEARCLTRDPADSAHF